MALLLPIHKSPGVHTIASQVLNLFKLSPSSEEPTSWAGGWTFHRASFHFPQILDI